MTDHAPDPPDIDVMLEAFNQVEKPCMLCGHTAWGISRDQTNPAVAQTFTLPMDFHQNMRGFALVPVTCLNCGLTLLINPGVALGTAGEWENG